MKVRARSLLLAALCLLTAPGLCLAQRQEEPPPKFEGSGLPEPPRQREPWTPPRTKLPEALVNATRTLFEQGLADPRGGEYREVEFVAGSVWGNAGKLKTHAWVLPAAAGEARRFAVSWGGLVTPVVSVGEPADLRLDIAEVIKADEELRAKWAEESHNPNFPFRRSGSVTSDSFSASHKYVQPLKVCLLLRLGEAGLAEQFWAAYAVGVEREGFGYLGDPYPTLALDWVYALFDRAVCAHMRGDDRLALLSARALVPLRERVSAELERRRASWPAGYNTPDQFNYLLSWLAPLDPLLADQERRAGESRKTTGSSKRTDEIGALVAELDEVAARQWGQPGGVDVGEDPRVRALVARGDEAVEPLLRALETDERLTRSVSFGRSFHPGRHLITVAETAYSALTRILKTNAFGGPAVYASPPDREGRRRLAARIRAYLEKYGRGAELLGTPMPNVKSFRERVLEGLADKAVVGTLRPRRTSRGDRYGLTVENTYTAVLTGSANSSEAAFQVTAEDARAPRALEALGVRVCDVYASRLASLSGAPRFQVYWTEAERDRAVAEMAAFLRNHTGRFGTSSGTY